jgi:hypothetical protein
MGEQQQVRLESAVPQAVAGRVVAGLALALAPALEALVLEVLELGARASEALVRQVEALEARARLVSGAEAAWEAVQVASDSCLESLEKMG